MLNCQHDFASRAAYVLRRRWLIWAVMAACYLIVYFHRIAPSVVADHLMATFSLSGVALGNLSAIYLYVYGFMQIPPASWPTTSAPAARPSAACSWPPWGA